MKVNKVEKAAKAYPNHGIEKGDTYYWWTFMGHKRSMSKEYPTARQLTNNGFMLSVYDLQDQINGFECEDLEDFENNKDCIKDELQNLLDEQQEKLDNMPEHLQESSSSGQLLQERIDALQEIIDEIDDIDNPENEEELEDKIDEIKNLSINI